MRRVAVTGTNGKTTTVEFCRQLFGHAGHRAASYGTLGLTTPAGRDPDPAVGIGPRALPALLSRLELTGTDVVALEAFSSGLASDVYDHVAVDGAVFTNLGRDHLDRHGDAASYFDAKRSLFADVLAADGTAVLNRDDDRASALLSCCWDRDVDVVTYGWRDDADVAVHDAAPSSEGVTAELSVRGQPLRVEFDFVGDVMVSNACAALATVLSTGMGLTDALEGLERLRAPPGRLDRVGVHDGVELFVDYAHTPAALRAALATLRDRTAAELVVVFGCGGDRDRDKRRRMGAIAAEYADRAIVTDDNPRSEDPAAIREAVLAGCPGARECGDRGAAIATAVETATDGDVVVVAGKGHERTQVVGDEPRPFSDHDVLRRLMAASRV